MEEIEVEELKARLDRGEAVVLLDVREPEEVAICSLPGAQHIPVLRLMMGIERPQAAPDQDIVVFCHVGERSREAARFLRGQGFPRAVSLAGGIDAWAARIDPSLPRY